MYNLIKAEIYRLKYNKEIRLCIILIIILGIINLYFHGIPTGRESLTNESTDMFSLMACAIFAGMYIGSEFSKRTIYHLIVSGHSRFSVLISKLTSYLIGCFIIIASNLFINGGIYSMFYGWGAPFNGSEIMFIVMYVLINILFILCIATMVFLVPFIVRDGAMATAVSVFIMGIFLALSQTFWSYTALNIASKVQVNSNIYITLIILAIPILVVVIGNILFKTQDIK